MLSLLAAAALMQPAAASAPAADPDLRCMAAYLYALGEMSADPKVKPEESAGVTSIVMYFFGKLRARRPSSDLAGEIKRLIGAPDYVERQVEADVKTCGVEFEARTNELDRVELDGKPETTAG